MRTIDADALIESIKECIEAKDANCEWEQVQGLECALECIDEEPTVQPGLHCPDCKYWDERLIRCNKHKDSMMYGVHDFCSKGKRKGADNG